MIQWHHLTRALLVFTLVTSACSTSRRRPQREKAPENPAIVELKRLLAEYHQELGGKDFEDAEEKLKQLETSIKRAEVSTITHPDYADLAAQARAARGGLATAKRDTTIGALIETTEKELKAADLLLEGIAETSPSDEKLDTLENTIERLHELVEEGRAQRKSSPYREYALELDPRILALTLRDRQHRWQLAASEDVQATIKDFAAPLSDLDPDSDLDEQIDRYEDTLDAFRECEKVTTQHAKHKDFVAEFKLHTALGALTTEATQNTCAARATSSQERLNKLGWMTEVQAALDRIRKAEEILTDAKTPAHKLEANEHGAPLYRECEQLLLRTEENTGFDAKVTFATPLGRLGAVKLRDACSNGARRLLAERPTLRWQIAVEQVVSELDEARREVKSTSSETDQEDKIEPLTAAIKGFTACSDNAGILAALKDPRFREARPDKAELKALKDLGATCRKEREGAERVLSAAKAALAPPAAEKKPAEKRSSPNKPAGKGSSKPKKR